MEKTSEKRGISFVLVAIMIIEFLVAGFKYPGFLVKDNSPEYETAYHLPGQEQTDTYSSFDVSTMDSDYGDDTDLFDDPSVLTANELPLIYTGEQIRDAEVMTADVTADNKNVVLGEVSVLIPSWELEPEGDQIEVRSLPELSMGENNWSIRAYDFSLASGVHEFDSDITITIPREGGAAECSGCVWFNEETGYWEDIYSEVSDDGKYYTIYTNHFSLFGEKKYRFDVKRLDLVIDDGSRLDLEHGIFIETRTSKGSRMEQKVRIDYDRFWNMYQNKTLDDVKDIGRSIELLTKAPKDVAFWSDDGIGPIVDTVGDVFGLVGLADGEAGLWGGLIGKKSPSPEALGQILTMADVALTGYKVYAEAVNNSATPYSKALADSVMDHKLDIFNTSVGVAGTFTPEVLNPYMAVVGLALYAYSWGYDRFITEGVDEWYKEYYPSEGEVYMRFYQQAGVRLYFETEENRENAQNDYHYALMDKPYSMDDDKYEQFAGFINDRGGIRTDSYKGFAAAFAKLVELYADEPEYLESVLDDFFRVVAGAFWRLPQKEGGQGAAGEGPRYKFLTDYKNLGKDPFILSRASQIKLSDSYVMRMKIDTLKIMENVTTAYQRKACEAVMRRMDKELLPIMNRKLVFHVTDGSLESGQSFADSVYCVDWKTINSNRKYRSLPDGEGTFDASFKTPMRFKGADKPVFLPLNYDESENSPKNYYPYDPNFLPSVKKNSDIVFKCTYYHYLMMGCPTKMIFTDVQTGESKEADISLPEISPTDGLRVTDVYISVNGRKQDKAEERQFKLKVKTATDITDGLPDDRPQNVTVTLKSDGTIVIDAPTFEFTRDEPTPWEGYTDHYEYRRGAFNVRGTVKSQKSENGIEGYSGNLEPGVSYSSGRVITGYTPGFLNDSDVDTPFEQIYRSTIHQTRGDSEFRLRIDSATGFVDLDLQFKGAVTEERESSPVPQYYDDTYVFESFSTTGSYVSWE